MTTIFEERPPPGWFVLYVTRKQSRKWDWCALMIDIDPHDLDDCCPGKRKASECWVMIPGKHRNRDAAWGAIHDLMATRH